MKPAQMLLQICTDSVGTRAHTTNRRLGVDIPLRSQSRISVELDFRLPIIQIGDPVEAQHIREITEYNGVVNKLECFVGLK